MKPDSILISVIIPTQNRSRLLAQSLGTIFHQNFSKETYEVIVVDNGSTDDTQEVIGRCQQYPDFKLKSISEPRLGLMFARHAGARAASADILLYTDDDIIADPQWVARIYNCFAEGEVAAVGGRVMPQFEGAVPSWLYQFGNEENCGPLSILKLEPGVSVIHSPQHLYGCNMAIRKSVLFQVGGFNPDGFPKHLLQYRGDGECGLVEKLYARGFKVKYDSEAIVHHIISVDRLTKEYFLNRAHREGFSKAYSVLRNGSPQNRTFILLYDMIKCFLGIIYFHLKKQLSKDADKRFRFEFQTVYLTSRARHAVRLLNDTKLRAFALMEDYINY